LSVTNTPQATETDIQPNETTLAGFAALGLNPRIIKGIEKLGYENPTPVQQQAIPKVMEQRDLLVNAETGSGKTAAFLLPAVNYFMAHPSPKTGTRCLILAPTRELAKQIDSHCNELAAFTYIKSGVITGGENFKHQISTLRKNPEIIIATPGRLQEHLESNNIDFQDLEMLVLDEADRMLDMGFAEDVLKIAAECNKNRQTLLFSATLDKRGLKEVADQVLTDPELLRINSARNKHENIQQKVVFADHFGHKDKIVVSLLQNQPYEKALIFTNTIDRADKLRGFLQYNKIKVAALHGDLDQKKRNKIMELLRSGSINVVVATDVASRGLDIQGIDLVINYDMARNSDDYVHRTGRTGRAGKQGLAISLIAHFEWDQLSNVQRYLKTQFEQFSIKGLEGSYTGPKKLKSNGKAAGAKKKKNTTTKTKGPAKKTTAKKVADKKTSVSKNKSTENPDQPAELGYSKAKKTGSGLRRGPASNAVSRDGRAPLKKR
jgi:superfamily II DNA/RNA helicase